MKQLGDHAGAVSALEQLVRLAPDDPDLYLRAVTCYLDCIALAANDPAVSETDRGPLQDADARKAVEWLRRAVDKGLITDPRAFENPKYHPVDGREDFQKLVREFRPRPSPIKGPL